MDNVYEQLITTYKTVQYRSVGALTFMSGGLAIIMILLNQIITAIFLIVVAAAAFYFKRYLYIEYKYRFNNGEIYIDKIIGGKKEKSIIGFNVKDIEIMAQSNSKSLKALANLPKKQISLYPVTFRDVVYIAVIKREGEKIKIAFGPDEKFIELCYKYNHNNVKKS